MKTDFKSIQEVNYMYFNSKYAKELINDSGYRLSFLCRQTGITRPSLYTCLSGKCEPKLELVIKLANFFKLDSIDSLILR